MSWEGKKVWHSKKHFMENHAENVNQKLVSDPFLIMAFIACKSFFNKIRPSERESSKNLKRVNFIVSFKPSLFKWTRLRLQVTK